MSMRGEAYEKRPYFVPPKYRQPDRYENFFSKWSAIFYSDGKEYHVQLVPNILDSSYENVKYLQILQQTPQGRQLLRNDIPSLKQAMEILKKILGKESVS